MQGGRELVGKDSMTESLADLPVYFSPPTAGPFCFSRKQQTGESGIPSPLRVENTYTGKAFSTGPALRSALHLVGSLSSYNTPITR